MSVLFFYIITYRNRNNFKKRLTNIIDNIFIVPPIGTSSVRKTNVRLTVKIGKQVLIMLTRTIRRQKE